MRARVQSANPQIRSQSRPQSAYQVHRPRLLDNTAGSAAFKNGGTNQNKLKAKHDPVEILGRQQHLVTTQSDEQPLWIKEAITMVKNGKPTRLKIG
jgi:hypothetical protein